jgi:hypothetical protein
MKHEEHRILYEEDENFRFEAFFVEGFCSVAAKGARSR